ncbi:DUF2520 domain-containing protein [Neisseria iguanae]|uniref:DUF2520 domain-containing protein n=1 Tax=Neisseria iguanae TaxID=90242 RepID=UPI001FEC39C0|nr:DUF2520 domain-containing protein [Neisseria iguanae]
MQQSIDNLDKLSPLQALTDPIVRGGDSTVSGALGGDDGGGTGRLPHWCAVCLERWP